MRIARVDDRLSILVGDLVVDVHRSSGGRFSADPDDVFPRWDEFVEWADQLEPLTSDTTELDHSRLGSPVLRPTQVFAIGLNYGDHASEAGVSVPSSPSVFTKFQTSLSGPFDPIALPSARVDWEVELVVVIGHRAEHVAEGEAWSYVAGVTVGQDISERDVQLAGPAPQFSLAKSFPGFSPVGPWIVTPDELTDPDDLELMCEVDGDLLQKGRTRDMVFSVPELVAYLSSVCPLLPGDLIFTGTPAGVGLARDPQRYLMPGTTLTSRIEGIGEIRNLIIAGAHYPAAS
jgi:2,4-didehydro-3-deoxy-L-rhamnonate hydrolase